MHSHTVLQCFFYWQKFHEKMKLKIKKLKMKCFLKDKISWKNEIKNEKNENEVFFFKKSFQLP